MFFAKRVKQMLFQPEPNVSPPHIASYEAKLPYACTYNFKISAKCFDSEQFTKCVSLLLRKISAHLSEAVEKFKAKIIM